VFYLKEITFSKFGLGNQYLAQKLLYTQNHIYTKIPLHKTTFTKIEKYLP